VKGAKGWHLNLQRLCDALTDYAPLVHGVAGIGQPMRAWLEGELARRGALTASALDPDTLPRLVRAWVTTNQYEVEECFAGLDRIWPQQTWLRAVVDAMLSTDSKIELSERDLDLALGACTDEEIVRCLGRDIGCFGCEQIFFDRLSARGPAIVPLLQPLCRQAFDTVHKYMPARHLIAMAVSARLGAEIPEECDAVVETVLRGFSIEELLRCYPAPRREALLLRRVAARDKEVWPFVAAYPTPNVVEATLQALLHAEPPYIESAVAAAIGRGAVAQVSAFIRTCPAEHLGRLHGLLADARSSEVPAGATVLLRASFPGLREVGAKILAQQRFGDLTPELIAEMMAGEEPAQDAAVRLLLGSGHDPAVRALARDLAGRVTARTPLLAARLAHAGEIEPEIDALLRAVPEMPPETKQRIDTLLDPSLASRYSVADDVVTAVKAGVSLPELVRWFLDRREAAGSTSAKQKVESVVRQCLAGGFLSRAGGFLESSELPLLTFRLFAQDAVGAHLPAWRRLFDARVLDERQLRMMLPSIAASDPRSVRGVLVELATRTENSEVVARCLQAMDDSRNAILSDLLALPSTTARATAADVLVAHPSGAAREALRKALAGKSGKRLRDKLERALAACTAVGDLDRQPADSGATLDVRPLPVALGGPVRGLTVCGDVLLATSENELALVELARGQTLVRRTGASPARLLVAPDGAFYASGQSSLEVWLIDGDDVQRGIDVELNEEVQNFLALPGRQMVVLSASGQADGWIHVRDVANGSEVGGTEFDGYPTDSAASADGKHLVVAADSGEVALYALPTVKRVKRLVAADEDEMPDSVDVAYFAAGERIVVASHAQNGPTTLRVFDSGTRKLVAQHEGIDERRLLTPLAAPYFATIGDTSLTIWNAAGERVRRLAIEIGRGWMAIAGTVVALATGDELRLWSPERHEWLARHRHASAIEAVVVAGTGFVFGDATGGVFRAELPTGAGSA